MTQAPEKFVGGGLRRKEDPALVTGRANWTDNITLPGMLHAVFMRSPYAHAKITSVDVSAAREQPGVVAVFSGADLDDEYEKHPRENPAAVTGYDLSLHDRRQGHTVTGETEEESSEDDEALVRGLDRPRRAQDPAPRPDGPQRGQLRRGARGRRSGDRPLQGPGRHRVHRGRIRADGRRDRHRGGRGRRLAAGPRGLRDERGLHLGPRDRGHRRRLQQGRCHREGPLLAAASDPQRHRDAGRGREPRSD